MSKGGTPIPDPDPTGQYPDGWHEADIHPAERAAVARAYDPEAFADRAQRIVDERTGRLDRVKAIQWAARQKLANDAAERLLTSDWWASVLRALDRNQRAAAIQGRDWQTIDLLDADKH